MSGGTLGQFILYAASCATSIGALSEVWGEVQLAGATERLVEILDVEPVIQPPVNPKLLPQPARGEIGFDGVTFHYPTRPEISALSGFSLAGAFRVRQWHWSAHRGPVKSTVFQLLSRFYDPQNGCITIDGVALPEMTPQTVRGALAVVPQETVVFAKNRHGYSLWAS